MSRERLPQVQEEEVVVDWSIVAIGGGIALLGLAAVAVTIVWLVLTRPPVTEEPAVLAREAPALPRREMAGGPAQPLILNQGRPERRREAGAWSVPVTETLPTPKKKVAPAPVVVTVEPEKPAVVRKPVKVPPRARFSESELVKQVENLPALELTSAGTTKELIKQLAHGARNKQYQEACDKITELAKRPELRGLPRHEGTQLASHDAANLAQYSSTYRMMAAAPEAWRKDNQRNGSRSIGYADQDKNHLPIDPHHLEGGLRTLMQIIPAEDKELRRQLIGSLSQSGSDQVNVALASRALFEFDADVRAAAVKVLSERYSQAGNYRKELMAGLRYPWPPIADHAADALLAVSTDDGIVPELIDMLDLPDPAAPIRNRDNKWVQAELVRINHLRNCLLCHVPFDGKTGQVRGAIPDPDLELPPPVVYYDNRWGSFVRADITLLRQDFSIKLKVADHGKWPALQRFDFVVRQRELTEDEVKNLERDRPPYVDYPQRAAVLHVLRGLTGIDAGQESAAWRQQLGKR